MTDKNESLIIILVVNDELHLQTASGRATRELVSELRRRQIVVVESESADDAKSIVLSNPALQAILLAWSLDSDPDHEKATSLINLIRSRNSYVPIFLMAKCDKYLFSWDKIPGNDCGRLIEFLKRKYDIEWVKTAKIEKIEGDKIIIANIDGKSLSLSLNNEKNKVNLRIDDGRIYEFIAKTENCNLNIYCDEISAFTAEVTRKVDELIYSLEDTSSFIAGRVLAAIRRYRDKMPPFSKALFNFAQVYEYSWHTPGHAGGTAFLKSPIGRAFYDYFGENLLRSDLSVSVDKLGSLLDHSGPIGKSEEYAARWFGANRSYTVTNGSSTSNRVIFMACVTHGDIVLVDRNCHKSLEQALTLTGAIPTYLMPLRNYLGIIGPIPPWQLTYNAIKQAIAENKLIANKDAPCYSVITNSTYDGLCYNVREVVGLLGQSVDRIHFDEAWYGYARFNQLYKDRFGMYGDLKDYRKDEPTIFTTISTHKSLAALSQASFIHVRDGRKPVEHKLFNESFMMHASTSPQYAIICSNEVSAAMMAVSGSTLTNESIQEAIAFRQAVRRIRRDYRKKDGWFFSTWNADEVKDRDTGNTIPFEDASQDLLVREPDCWVLHPDEAWHGFGKLKDGYCMLDPIKVSVVTPGIATDGSFEKMGIPARLVTAYLGHRGIVVEKTTDFTILFLFSIGITKGKWVTLVNALLKFKDDYDKNVPLVEVLPDLVKTHPDRYGTDGILGLRDLADKMFDQMNASKLLELQKKAFSSLPRAEMTTNQAYQKLVHNQIESVEVDKMANRTVATGVVPYPPGIPMLMPGENAGAYEDAYLGYLRALQMWDAEFPGFDHIIHGVEKNKGGKYQIYCLKLDKGQQ